MGINTIKKLILISKRECVIMKTLLYLIIIFHQFTINVHSTIIDLYVFSLPDTCHPFSIQVYISVLINSGSGLTKTADWYSQLSNPHRLPPYHSSMD